MRLGARALVCKKTAQANSRLFVPSQSGSNELKKNRTNTSVTAGNCESYLLLHTKAYVSVSSFRYGTHIAKTPRRIIQPYQEPI